MIRFIHTADIHFGMENYGKIDPATGIHTRLLDFDRALSFCVDTAIKENVDFFLFCGDAYKTAHPSPTQQRLFLKSFLRLYQANIPVVITIGNHDSAISFGRAHALDIFSQLPVDGFQVLAKPAIVQLATKSGPIQLVGIPWPSRTTLALHSLNGATTAELTQLIAEKVCTLIQQFAAELDPNIPAVLAGHLTVSSGIFSGSEKHAVYGNDPLFLPSQLAIQPFDYVALGHLHRFQDLNASKGIPVVYPGSLERIDFGERNEEKGFCLVTLHAKEKTTYEFIKTPTRPFIQIEVHLQQETGQTDKILTALKQHSIDDAVLKIVYHIAAGIKDRVNSTVIQAACAAAHYIVGIIPIRAPETRTRRTHIGNDKNLHTLLQTYFDTKPDLSTQKERLIAKALELEYEMQELEELKPIARLTGECIKNSNSRVHQ